VKRAQPMIISGPNVNLVKLLLRGAPCCTIHLCMKVLNSHLIQLFGRWNFCEIRDIWSTWLIRL